MTDTGHPPTVAIAQVQSVPEPERNLETAKAAVFEAERRAAVMIVFPEYFMSWRRGGHESGELARIAEPLDGPFVDRLSALARDARMWIVAGVIESARQSGERPFNTTVLLDGQGSLAGAYRKTHLFDAYSYRESDSFSCGNHLFQPIDTPVGRTGLLVCYDLRFPEVARQQALAGATCLFIPSAWVAGPTKDMQWSTLLQARAIENGCHVIAAAQVGNEYAGQSMIVDPTGVIVAQGGNDECVITAVIDPCRVENARAAVPTLANRRPDLYQQ
ncbi:MAG TPA: carbon-nitrogen hydrolase family protein [Chloroflexota bacterium]|jgi:predicted amidohydrolase|nr:carbon-nitrogen hydrolase family protein [Chloroflexota bacterium]